MPPKKKGPSKAAVENEQQVRALLSAYAGAARAWLTRPSADLVKRIEEVAEKSKPLECVALAEPLGAPGVQAICDVLAGYPKCRNLQLWRCGIGDEGLDAISTYLKASTRPWTRASQLKLLDVAHDNGFAPNSAAVVAQTAVAMDEQKEYAGEPLLLNDARPAFSPRALWNLGDALASVLGGDDPAGGVGAGVGGKGGVGMTLKVLKLDRNFIGDEGCAVLVRGLAACKSISVLHLTHNNLGPTSARAISGLMKEKPAPKPPQRLPPDPNVALTDVERAALEAEVADAVAATEEEELTWAPYPGGGGGLGGKDWAVCKLTELYIGNNPLGTEGVAHLAEGLGHSTHLKVLSMPHVGLGDDVAAMKVLVAGLEKNSSLTHLDLARNHLGESASLLLPVLALKEDLRQCRVSERVQRHVVYAIKEIIVKRCSKKKGGKKKGGGKKKKK